ncbi:MAG: DEAD/DEAH box helicase [Myxococcota bacterium]
MKYRGLTLDRFQEEAVHHIDDGESVLVAAPTGTGKTLVADYLIEQVLDEGGEIIYTAPVKALSNQKYREYTRQFGREKIGLVTGDLVINRDAPVRIMTTEILRNMLLEGGHGGIVDESDIDDEERRELEETASPSDTTLREIERLQAVIVDEIHFLDDDSRGTVWEELLIYLPNRIRILGLSATASNLEEIAEWLSEIRETDVKVVREDERAVPLRMHLASVDTGVVSIEEYNRAYGRHKKDRGRSKKRGMSTNHYDVFDMLDDESFPALYFIFSRKLVERLAKNLAKGPVGKRLGRLADTNAINARLRDFQEEFPDVLTPQLKSIYRKGIAFHHAGIHVALKALVEELYEARLLNALYCTSTFALGINMPARTVIFDSLTKYNGTDVVPLTIREFMQMAGRAGRRGIDEVGDIVVRQDFNDYDEVRGLLKNLLSDRSEPVESSFNLSWHSVVNLVARFDESDIRSLLERSFKAFQSSTNADRLRHQIGGQQEQDDTKDADDLSPEGIRESRKERRRLAQLKRELAEEERPRMWEEFQRKLTFLRSYNYLTQENELEPPARILRHLKMEEIFLTELIVNGVLEDLNPDELFGAMCGLVISLPRSARVKRPSDDKWWKIFDDFTRIFESDIVESSEPLVDSVTTFTPEVMPLGERWALGHQLNDIMDDIKNPTDMSGDLVGAFRRGKDLVGQLRDVHYSDAPRRRELTRLIRRVSRDEVEVLD